MKDLSTFQHYVGCDVSKDTLDFAIHNREKEYRAFDHIRVPNSAEGFKEMRNWLKSFKIKVKDVVIAMEHTGSYSSALAECCFKKGITFVFLHPLDVKNAAARGRNKTDKEDAQFIADYVYTMREKLTPSLPEEPVIKTLRQLRNERQLAVRSRTAYKNQIKVVTDKATLRRMEKLINAFTAEIKAIEAAMQQVIDSEPQLKTNCRLLRTIPGIGFMNAVTTIIATGNFTRFQTARQYAKFSCISPLSCQSGTSVRNPDRVSRAGHGEIKALLTEAARSAMCHDSAIRSYYQRKRAQGKSHGSVMNAIKFKLICRMFAVIRRQTPYVNTDAYLQ